MYTEELRENIWQMNGGYFNGQPYYKVEDGRIFMECQPSLSVEQRAALHTFEEILRMEVLYEENSGGKLKMAED